MDTVFDNVFEVGVFGDWHSNTRYARKILSRMIHNPMYKLPDVFVHLGDFNFFPDDQGQRFLNTINEILIEADREMFVIDGNHEDFNYIATFEDTDYGFKKVRSNLFYIPRGTGWIWGGKKFVGLGGANSIDYKYRTLGYNWFLEEDITQKDVEKAISFGNADYVFTHEAAVDVPVSFNIYDPRIIASTENNKRFVRDTVRALNPKYAFHGHHHKFYIDQLPFSEIVSIGLNKDASSFGENYVVIDLLNDRVLGQFEKIGKIF